MAEQGIVVAQPGTVEIPSTTVSPNGHNPPGVIEANKSSTNATKIGGLCMQVETGYGELGLPRACINPKDRPYQRELPSSEQSGGENPPDLTPAQLEKRARGPISGTVHGAEGQRAYTPDERATAAAALAKWYYNIGRTQDGSNIFVPRAPKKPDS